MKNKTSFSQSEMNEALGELRKVWQYERFPYFDTSLTDEDVKALDGSIVSYGIKLGTLRKLFTETE